MRVLAILMFLCVSALAHDRNNPEQDEWYQSLTQPDNPNSLCCGINDSYWCDTIHVREGKTFCIITDDRPDAPLGRDHVDIGTEIFIPDNKLTWKDGNPTGHAIVFMSKTHYVFCFVQAGGY